MPNITIAGHVFDVPVPDYVVGYAIQHEGEAAALRQVFLENIRNNNTQKVKNALNGAESLTDEQKTKLQSEITQYAGEYRFAGRRQPGTGRVVDPVEREALRMAKDDIAAAYFAKNGERVKGEALNEAAQRLIAAKGDEYMRRARRAVRERDAAAQAVLAEAGIAV